MFWLLLYTCQQDGGGWAGDTKDRGSLQQSHQLPAQDLLVEDDGGPGSDGLDATWQLELATLLTAGEPADDLPAEDDGNVLCRGFRFRRFKPRSTFSGASFSRTLDPTCLRQLTKLLVWPASSPVPPPLPL